MLINIKQCHIREASHRNMSVNQLSNAGKQRTACCPVKNQVVSGGPETHAHQERGTYN